MTKQTQPQEGKRIDNLESLWYKDFCKDARYMKDSPRMKYNIRYNGTFICAESPEELFKKYKLLRQQ